MDEHQVSLQDALDSYVDAAVDYRNDHANEWRSSRDRDAAQVAMVQALDSLITARIMQLSGRV